MMSDLRTILERGVGGATPPPNAFERVLARRDRKRRNQRIAAGVVGIAVFALAAIGFVRLLGSESTPAGDPRSPFQGTWVSTDADESTQTMTIAAPEDGAVEIMVQDDAASVCSGAPSTMTGTGRLEGSRELVISSPLLTCDDGSEPEAASGLPLQEQLRDLTFVHNSVTDVLTDNLGSLWQRIEPDDPSPEPTRSGGMWPQSSLEEVREAQRLADAGDPRYTWQVDPELEVVGGGVDGPYDAEIFARFIREELGWEEFRFLAGYDFGLSEYARVRFFRCAPGRTSHLPSDECAPTIDELLYETVTIDVAQLGRLDPSGIWVVTRWAITSLEQVTPSEAETAHLEAFLQARIDGEGAEEYLYHGAEGFPLLYATTTGAPYERSEFELVGGPEWSPLFKGMFKVRLFAENGETVVEQFIWLQRNETGRLELFYSLRTFLPTGTVPGTTENGQAVPSGTAS
jgi:hypothetical protein